MSPSFQDIVGVPAAPVSLIECADTGACSLNPAVPIVIPANVSVGPLAHVAFATSPNFTMFVPVPVSRKSEISGGVASSSVNISLPNVISLSLWSSARSLSRSQACSWMRFVTPALFVEM